MEFAQNRVSWGFYDARTLLAQVKAWRALIEREDFDVVVGDFALPAIIAADSLGIPTVTIQNVLWTSVSRFRLTPPDRYWIHRRLARVGLAWLSRLTSRYMAVTNLLYAGYQRVWARPFNVVRLEFGLQKRLTYFSHTEGQLVLVPDKKELWDRYGSPRLTNYVAVGPIIWEPDQSLASGSHAIQRLIDSGQRFVYASLGSSGTVEVFQLLFDAFSRRCDALALVLTTGEQFPNWSGWKNAPPCVVVEPFYPGGLAIAAAGCVATINHGGSGSAYQAWLAAPGKPLIMIPTHADQQWNAEMLQGLGLGVVLLSDGLTAERLNREIDRFT